ncbi:GIY-YIG nuclease family protein [Pseudomonas aeruginosa]|uniref:GIY-YIG nuclease family protein n=1 Tax=Pseudomonas aeruginosa TaxID=287 RepID=UPI000691662A|nr:GIY-YIG nuclease family protein [Pseudomonas aeruginosa]HEJ9830433.1 GIY-YIG nuclease family protein [Pseudomonas aeruginosa]
MNYGFIYCMANDSMPGLYKIGMTERPPSYRRNELSNSTSSPTPFEILLYAEVERPRDIERLVHGHLYEYRVNDGREFFRIPDLKIVHELFIGISDLVLLTNQAEFIIYVEPEIAA